MCNAKEGCFSIKRTSDYRLALKIMSDKIGHDLPGVVGTAQNVPIQPSWHTQCAPTSSIAQCPWP